MVVRNIKLSHSSVVMLVPKAVQVFTCNGKEKKSLTLNNTALEQHSKSDARRDATLLVAPKYNYSHLLIVRGACGKN